MNFRALLFWVVASTPAAALLVDDPIVEPTWDEPVVTFEDLSRSPPTTEDEWAEVESIIKRMQSI